MTGRQMLFNRLVEDGFFVDELRESREIGVQEGVQEGMQKILQFWKNGHSLEEAERQFSLQLQTSRQK